MQTQIITNVRWGFNERDEIYQCGENPIPIAYMTVDGSRLQPDSQEWKWAEFIGAGPDILKTLVKARNALALVDDWDAGTGGAHPDIHNRAIDDADALIREYASILVD